MPVLRTLITALLLTLPTAGPLVAQMSIEGEVGTDLGINRIENTLLRDRRTYDVDRRLSKQILGLRIGGPVATTDFAEYLLRFRLAGTYNRVSSQSDGIVTNNTDYVEPELDNVFASLTLFPLRTYPLRYTYGMVTVTTNRYEPGRRADTQAQSPGLAVIRRYESDTEAHRLRWETSLPRQSALSVEVKHETNELSRQYDFGEDLDIWIIFTPSTPDPAPSHAVDVVNTLDDDVILFIDLALVDTLSAGEALTLDVLKGVHEIDLVPARYNRFNTSVDVQSSMQWRIVYIPPKGSADLDQSTDGADALLRLGDNESRFKNETRFLYNDITENIQGMVSTLGSVNSQTSYNVRDGLDVDLTTTYANTTTDVADVSSQEVKSLLQQTQGRWYKRGGPSASLSHSFNSIQSINQGDALKSKTNVVTALGNIPTGRLGHVTELRATATSVADNKDYSTDQLQLGADNKADIKVKRFRLRPKHSFKYAKSSVTNAGDKSESNETQSQIRLDGERPRLRFVNADLRFKAEWEWRLRDTGTESETKNRYLGELGLFMTLSEKLKVMTAVTKDNETYSTKATNTGEGDIKVRVRPDRARSMYRMDVQAAPAAGLTLNVNGMLISQEETRIKRGSVALSGRMPRVNLPIRAFVVKESKDLGGGTSQSLTQMEASTNYRYRDISIVLSYSLFSESLVTEEYSYSEVYVKISRAFTIK